jgi:hypothetical protein
VKEFLLKYFTCSTVIKIRNLYNDIRALPFLFNLDKLGIIYGTDKTGEHHYTGHYKRHFKPFRFKAVKLLEIGVGGYEDPYSGAASLRMWKRYFPFSKIYSIDIHNKTALQERRIKIYKGSQVDFEFMERILEEIGELDLIIDDGSHINSHVIDTFKFLFPRLKENGIYVIEDTQTSYWPEYGGDSKNLSNPDTIMNYFKRLADSLNNKEFILKDYKQDYFDKKVKSVHFYHNMIFIYKGDNNEESNLLINNMLIETEAIRQK